MLRLTLGVAMLAALAAAPALADEMCGADALAVQVRDGSIGLVHSHAEYNCCTTVTQALAVEGNRLVVTETEVWDHPCYCNCCFELAALITGVAPGEWVVAVRWFDESGAWRELSAPVTVPAARVATGPALGWARKSDCGGTTAVPDGQTPEPAFESWGVLKARYR